MSAGTTPASSERAEFVEPRTFAPPRRRRRRRWVVVAVTVVVLGSGAVVVVHGVYGRPAASSASSDNETPTSLVTIERRSLSKQLQINGELGFAGSYTVVGQGHGTVTWLPAVGQVVAQGQVLYQVDGAPVVLLYGSAPAWRALASGTTGADVAQLNHALVALGYVKSADVSSAWDKYNWATTAGVKKLQKQLSVDQSGQLSLGEVAFLPDAARVTALQANLGAPASGPLLQATSTHPSVSVALAVDMQSQVKAGDQVTITLPGGATTHGTVTSVGTVATDPSSDQGGAGGAGAGGSNNSRGGNSDSSTPTVPVTIQPTDPNATGSLDQAPVLVGIITTTVQDALAVPVYALLALADGGYAVEVADAGGTRQLVAVTPGLFDDSSGLVQVTGSGLSEGQHVVVPAS